MTHWINRSTTGKSSLAVAALAMAAFYGLASTPAQATMPREILPRHHAPAIHHRPPTNVIQQTVISNTLRTVRDAAGRAKTDDFDDSDCLGLGVCEVGQGGSGSDIGNGRSTVRGFDNPEAAKKKALEKKLKELEKRKKELEKKRAKIKDDFLKSKKGKATKKKIDKEAKKRDKKIKDATYDKNMKDPGNCCGSQRERLKLQDEWKKKYKKAWKDFNEAEKKIFEDELKKKDPKKFKDYKKAEGELDKTKGEIKKAEQKLDRLNKPTNKARVQP